MKWSLLQFGVCLALLLGFSSADMRGRTLRQIAAFDLPGPAGQRFDYLSIDDEDHFLLSAHLAPGILYVIDLRTNKVVKAISGVPGITSLEFVPGTRKVYTSDWGEEKIGVVDLRTMTVIKRLATEAKPNGSTYAAPFRKDASLRHFHLPFLLIEEPQYDHAGCANRTFRLLSFEKIPEPLLILASGLAGIVLHHA
jgi:hypothetical protein